MTNTAINRVSNQITVNGGKEAMVYGRYRDRGYSTEPVASKAGGVITPERVSPLEALAMGDLSFTAEKRELFYMGADGPRLAPGQCSVVRADTDALLGNFKDGYEVLQHQALALVLERLGDQVQIEQVLSIRQGAKAYITARIAQGDVGGDAVVRHLHLFNSHDGSSAFGALFTDTRLWCANQLGTITRGRAADELLRHSHTRGIHRFAENLVHRIDTESGVFLSEMEALARLRSVPANADLAKRILEYTFKADLAKPVRDKETKELRERQLVDLPVYETIKTHLVSGIGVDSEDVRGSLYRLFNATTQALTHDSARTRANGVEQARARFESLMGGASAQRIDRCREAVLAAAR
jgi:hypothetical protein